ncbi:SDR family oxidoreductase [Vibrio hannami]|uniref:UDP-glucose 4-epimerase family protein n=1 Tax=Vibrio hannami TaxID=2717094 RepID=UPI002410B0F4|nr:SDR family oxidoreductase [Vibrio hannami]MDG3086943.1 SDR family oxidoreductase [Vibrio hannami]
MKVLITGSTGFVGKEVAAVAASKHWHCILNKRADSKGALTERVNGNVVHKNVSSDENWKGCFDGVDCIIHCAARVHQMKESDTDALSAYKEVNTLGTLNLARQAAEAGVKRFVFLSSIKVNGELTQPGESFRVDVERLPEDPYGLSKFEAEQGLKELSNSSDMEVVIIRLPLVYGPGVKANFLSMIRWVEKGIPLPLRSINNRRSMVFLDNLVDLIIKCSEHPNAANKTFLVSDDNDVSLSSLLAMIAKSLGQKNMMFPFPGSLLKLATTLVGKPDIGTRLCGNLQLDISKTKSELDWLPPYSVEQGIQKTVDDYLKNKTL